MRYLPKVQDPVLLILAIIATLMGVVIIGDAGVARAVRDGGSIVPDEVRMQVKFLPIAFLGFWVASRIPRATWQRGSRLIGLVCVLALVAVEIFGHEMGQAKRWIDIGPVSVQPAEFVKIGIILYLAGALAHRKDWIPRPPQPNFGAWIANVGLPKLDRLGPGLAALLMVALVEREKDLGTASVIAVIAMLMFFVGNVSRRSMMFGLVLAVVGAGLLVKVQPYRWDRVSNHLHRWSEKNVDDTGFQTVQSELHMAMGGLTGVGPGAGRVKDIIPAPTTDFVMATVAEEFGYAGFLAVMSIIALIVWRLWHLSMQAPTNHARLVLQGIAGWIGVQTCVNVMMANGFLPAIGIPIPFISSGGSSLASLWFAMGISQAMMTPVKAVAEVPAETAQATEPLRPTATGTRHSRRPDPLFPVTPIGGRSTRD